MRPLVPTAFVLLTALTLSACAASGPGPTASLSADESARLQRDCDTRGGILVPSGRLTGQASLDNICRIQDGSRLPLA